MKICACLAEKNVKDCITSVGKINADKIRTTTAADLIEHRIDYLEDCDNISSLRKIHDAIKLPIIATCRSQQNQGKFKGSEEERINVLIKAVEAGYDYVDIEEETPENLKNKIITYAKKHKCKVIVSYHDFNSTPSRGELVEILKEMQKSSADIAKIVTTANSREDVVIVMDLIAEGKKLKIPTIGFCMGALGRASRVLCLVHGSPFTYAAINHSTAPGQLTLTEMKEEVAKLK